jgi:thiamine transport system substrate-binding protein
MSYVRLVPVRRKLAMILPAMVLLASCASTAPKSKSPDSSSDNTVRLVAYDSFTPPKEVWEEFAKESGITVEVLLKGDTGSMLNTTILSKDTPFADVIWGVDSTFASRALSSKVLRPHELNTDVVDPRLTPTSGVDVLVPVDTSEVCVNADTRQIPGAASLTLDDLARPEYKDKFVVQNPATSAPGMAFFLATIAKYGETGWQKYWQALVANGLKVVNGWEEAWSTEFSGASSGTRSLVVSYSNSPAAFVVFGSDPAATSTPIAVLDSTCIAVTEFAGLIASSDNPNAKKVLEFLISERFQRELATSMFVYPSRTGVGVPEVYTRLGVHPVPAAFTVDASRVQQMRDAWVDEWTEIVLG